LIVTGILAAVLFAVAGCPEDQGQETASAPAVAEQESMQPPAKPSGLEDMPPEMDVPRSPETTEPLKAGDLVPDVAVLGAEGEEISLARAVTEQPTVLVFYRGGW